MEFYCVDNQLEYPMDYCLSSMDIYGSKTRVSDLHTSRQGHSRHDDLEPDITSSPMEYTQYLDTTQNGPICQPVPNGACKCHYSSPCKAVNEYMMDTFYDYFHFRSDKPQTLTTNPCNYSNGYNNGKNTQDRDYFSSSLPSTPLIKHEAAIIKKALLLFSSLTLFIARLISSSNTTTATKPSPPFSCQKKQGNRISTTTWLVLFFLSVICVAEGLPYSGRRGSHVEPDMWGEGVNRDEVPGLDPTEYLMQFGFLPQAPLETGALRSEEELEDGIRTFQRFANLKQTGVFDNQTVAQMLKPRCGVPDLGGIDVHVTRHHHGDNNRRHYNGPHGAESYVLGPSKWEKKHLTYRILNYTPDLHQVYVHDAITSAFRVWSDVTFLTFSETYYDEADILIKFARYYHTDGYPFDGPGMILAHAFFPGDDRGGDVHFDEDETWTRNTDEGTNLFSVAAHEIGHALGLAHSNTLGALMYPWYQGYMPNFQLHHDDINAIQYLYGRREHPYVTPNGPSYTQRPEPTMPPREPPTTPTTTTRRHHHRPTRPTRPTTTTRPHHRPPVDPDVPPDPCTTTIDAAANLRSEIFMFKDKWMWRIDGQGVLQGYPVDFKRMWYGLPDDFDHVDAVYERPTDDKIIFFKGDRYFVFTANEVDLEYRPNGRPITDFGFPHDIKKIDAAFVWGLNGKTYFITDKVYWRYDEKHGVMNYNYPRDMERWVGVHLPVSAVLMDLSHQTHFFKGRHFWRFNDIRMQIYPERKSLGTDWLDCAITTTEATPRHEESVGRSNMAVKMSPFIGQYFCVVLLFIWVSFGYRS